MEVEEAGQALGRSEGHTVSAGCSWMQTVCANSLLAVGRSAEEAAVNSANLLTAPAEWLMHALRHQFHGNCTTAMGISRNWHGVLSRRLVCSYFIIKCREGCRLGCAGLAGLLANTHLPMRASISEVIINSTDTRKGKGLHVERSKACKHTYKLQCCQHP